MSARHKLNSAYLAGSLVIAGAAGALTKSWIVFFIVAAVLIAFSVHDGGIRLKVRSR